MFVGQLVQLATAHGVPGHIMAPLLSPVATELPETMNALIWLRQGKERLTLANISGAIPSFHPHESTRRLPEQG